MAIENIKWHIILALLICNIAFWLYIVSKKKAWEAAIVHANGSRADERTTLGRTSQASFLAISDAK
jgi:hypothetical protein